MPLSFKRGAKSLLARPQLHPEIFPCRALWAGCPVTVAPWVAPWVAPGSWRLSHSRSRLIIRRVHVHDHLLPRRPRHDQSGIREKAEAFDRIAAAIALLKPPYTAASFWVCSTVI